MESFITAQGSYLSPVDIELFESAGPIAPVYFYQTELHLSDESDKLVLKVDQEAGEKVEGLQDNLHVERDFSEAEYKELVRKFEALNIQSLKSRKLTPETKKLVGISFNYLEISIGEDFNLTFEYILTDLKKPEFQAQAKLIEELKKLR